MARPQRGNHRLTDEPVPAIFQATRAHHLPRSRHSERPPLRGTREAVSTLEGHDRHRRSRSAPGTIRSTPRRRPCRRDWPSDSERRDALANEGGAGGDGRMGPGIRTKIASKRALHRRYARVPAMPEGPRRRRFAALYPGEPETCRRSLRPFLLNFAHLSLLLAVFIRYNIEDRPFQGHTFQALVTLALLAPPGALPGPFPMEEAAVRRRLDGRPVLDRGRTGLPSSSSGSRRR